jgi:hypothetical protein
MNDNGDYTDEMTDSMISEGEPIDLDDWTIEALLTGNVGALNGSAELHADLVRTLGELRAYGHQPPPAPSAELAAMLHEDIIPLFPVRSKRKSRLYVSGWLVAGAAVVIAGAGVAAAAHQLPDDAQRVVSRVVNNLTPFHVDPVRDSGSNQPSSPAGGTGSGGWVFPGGSSGSGGSVGAAQPSSSPAPGTGSAGRRNDTATSRPTAAGGSVASAGASPNGAAPGDTGGAVVADPTSTSAATQPTPQTSPTGGTAPTPTSSSTSSGGGKGSTKPHSSSPGGGKSGAGAAPGSPTATATGGATQNGQ